MKTTPQGRWFGRMSAVLVGSFLAIAVTGLGVYLGLTGWFRSRPAVAQKQNPAVWSRQEFASKVMGKTEEEVVSHFGKPDRTSKDPDAVYWHYHKRTRDPATGEPDSDVQLVFRNGKVDAISF